MVLGTRQRLSLSGDKCVSGSVVRIQSMSCCLKEALLDLGLHMSLATSYLDPSIPTKALLSADGSQINIALGEYK